MSNLTAEQECIACSKEFTLPFHTRLVCCSGTDCGCYGATIPDSFCSLSCYENYDPTPYCSYGHRTKEQCDCGPIAENE